MVSSFMKSTSSNSPCSLPHSAAMPRTSSTILLEWLRIASKRSEGINIRSCSFLRSIGASKIRPSPKMGAMRR